jgi:hypothetical protein
MRPAVEVGQVGVFTSRSKERSTINITFSYQVIAMARAAHVPSGTYLRLLERCLLLPREQMAPIHPTPYMQGVHHSFGASTFWRGVFTGRLKLYRGAPPNRSRSPVVGSRARSAPGNRPGVAFEDSRAVIEPSQDTGGAVRRQVHGVNSPILVPVDLPTIGCVANGQSALLVEQTVVVRTVLQRHVRH